MQSIVLKMGPGAEYLVLRDEKLTQIWHPPGTSFRAGNEGNINGEGARERGKRRGTEREVYICKQSNFPSVLDGPKKNFTRKCRKACLW